MQAGRPLSEAEQGQLYGAVEGPLSKSLITFNPAASCATLTAAAAAAKRRQQEQQQQLQQQAGEFRQQQQQARVVTGPGLLHVGLELSTMAKFLLVAGVEGEGLSFDGRRLWVFGRASCWGLGLVLSVAGVAVENFEFVGWAAGGGQAKQGKVGCPM